MRKCSQRILKFKKLVSEQRGIFNILYEKDVTDSLIYYEQASLGSGNYGYDKPLVNHFDLHILKGALKELMSFFTTAEQLLGPMKRIGSPHLAPCGQPAPLGPPPSRLLPTPAPSTASHPPVLLCLDPRPSRSKVVSSWWQIRGIPMQQLVKMPIKRDF